MDNIIALRVGELHFKVICSVLELHFSKQSNVVNVVKKI